MQPLDIRAPRADRAPAVDHRWPAVSGLTCTPARSGSVTAYWPQRRNSGHDVQSWAIFSGTHMCGTIVKPSLTKCDGWCVKAQSVAKPRAAPRRRPARSPAAGRSGFRGRARRRRATAPRRRCRSAARAPRSAITAPSCSATMKRGACATISSIVRGSRCPASRLSAISRSTAGGVRLGRLPECHHRHARGPPNAAISAASSSPIASSISAAVMM